MSRPKKQFHKHSNSKAPEVPVRRRDILPRVLGTKDVSSADYKYWNSLLNKIMETVSLYGFNRVETPVIENFSLFKKYPRPTEIYNFAPNRTDRLALRPDLTHGLARFYLEQGLEPNRPVKLFSYGPVFRQENQMRTGSYRQFTQFAFEVFGEAKPIGEALLIAVIYNFFKELQIDVQIQINSLGSFDCQKEFYNKLSKYYKERSRKFKFCPECRKNLLNHPLRLLDCEEPACVEARKEAPQISNFLSEESNQFFTRVLEYLDELGVNYNFNPWLVKRLNYYTETIFEVWPTGTETKNSGRLSLGRGGRYNSLLEQLGGGAVPAFGFAGGFERAILKLKEKNLPFKKDDNIVFVAQVSDTARLRAISLFAELNYAGFKVRQSFTTDDLREQLEEAKRLEAAVILILGKKEAVNETILFRDVEQGVQEVIAQKDLKDRLKKKFSEKK